MKADPSGVLTGTHFIDGDHACCEGALAAGSRFAAGYPITPSTEVVERFASRVPTVGGSFIQMEDELAAEQACVEMIREIAREGREAIARGDYALIESAEAREALFQRVTGRIPAAKSTSQRG